MYKVLKVELIYVRVYTYINTSTYQQVRSILNTGTDIRHIVGLLSAHGLRFDSHKISHLPISVIAAFSPPKHLLSSPSTLPLALRSLTPFLIHRHPPNSPLPILLSLRNFRNRNFRRRSGSLSISCASLCGIGATSAAIVDSPISSSPAATAAATAAAAAASPSAALA